MHAIEKLYLRQFDFPVRDHPPALQYMLASIPRSGSTYLGLLLWRTGAMGAPMEYNTPSFMNLMSEAMSVNAQSQEYWLEVMRRRTSPNGVFGYKLFIANYMDLEKCSSSLIPMLAPDKVIFLRRRSTILQAISLYKASSTKAWFAGMPKCADPEYAYEAIRNNLTLISNEVGAWECIFKMTDASVLTVYYEDLLEDPHGQIEIILTFVGVDRSCSPQSDVPLLGIQRDEVSYAWRDLFVEDLRSRSSFEPERELIRKLNPSDAAILDVGVL